MSASQYHPNHAYGIPEDEPRSRIPDGRPVQVFTKTHELPGDVEVLPHCHPEGQLWAVFDGVVIAQLDGQPWLIPCGRIAWIPPGLMHSATVYKCSRGWMAYIQPQLCDVFPSTPGVFAMTELSHALLNRVITWDKPQPMTAHMTPPALTSAQERLLMVLIDELAQSEVEPMRLLMPGHPGLRSVALALLENPADNRPLAALARQAGLSERGLTRHFREDTGLSLTQWRTQARMTRAVTRLLDEVSVTTLALELGYDNVSHFIATFKRTFGVTPARYRSATTADKT